MRWLPSNVGAEPKRIAILAVLVIAAGYFFITNRTSGDTASAAPRPSLAAAPAPIVRPRAGARVDARPPVRVTQQGLASLAGGEFRPSLNVEVPDPSSVDPTLHLDLLTKLKTVPMEAGTRSLFEVLAAPPSEVKEKEPEKISVGQPFVGPLPPRPPDPPPPDPTAPPIPLRFYGFVNKTKVGDKRAFFLDGEDIIIASEGEMIKKRYKIVRIGVNSAVVEDTLFKSNNQQTLPLEAEMAG
jgi:hypothetical protein